MIKFDLVKITKIGKVKNPVHPNSNYGESLPFHVGYFVKKPVIGERFNLGYVKLNAQGISTSPVKKIINKNTFETLNSVYKYEKLK